MHRSFPEFTLQISHETKKALKATCFRDAPGPGVFLHWSKADEVFQDAQVREALEDEVVQAITQGDGIYSFSIDCGERIGMAAVIPANLAGQHRTEQRALNRKATGLFVVGMAPPLTELLTIIYRLNVKKPKSVVELISIYPGVDVGVLEGDVSSREDVVFLDWKVVRNPRAVDRIPPEEYEDDKNKRRKRSMHKVTKCEEPLSDGRLCGAKTTEGKSRCLDHNRYAAAVEARLQKQLQQEKKIDINSQTAREMFVMLKLEGPRTIERLAAELQKDIVTVRKYVFALKKAKLLTTKKTKRGAVMVSVIVH